MAQAQPNHPLRRKVDHLYVFESRDQEMELTERLRNVEETTLKIQGKLQANEIVQEEIRASLMQQFEHMHNEASLVHEDIKKDVASLTVEFKQHVKEEREDRKIFVRTMVAMMITAVMGMAGFFGTYIIQHNHEVAVQAEIKK